MRHLSIVVGILIGMTGSSVFAADPVEQQVRVTAGRVNIRTADGEWRCTIDRRTTQSLVAVGRHADGERVKVRINAKGCPGEGYIYSNYIRPYYGAGHEEVITSVEPEELALRSKPNPNAGYLCGLGKDSKVRVLEDNPPGAKTASWVRVEVIDPEDGCPKEGFVNGSYLKVADAYKNLPVTSESAAVEKGNTEAEYCPEGTCGRERVTDAAAIEDIGAVVAAATPNTPAKGGYWDGLRDMLRNPKKRPKQLNTHRGLVQMPLEGASGSIGPCGSVHYNPDKPKGVDAYANPLTACAFMSVLQDWKKNSCPDNSRGCRVAWGDISHKTSAKFNGHATHTDGQCIDIRPLRKGSFENAGLCAFQMVKTTKWVRSKGRKVKVSAWVCPSSGTPAGGYDRAKTTELITALKKAGGSNVYFNDTATGGGKMSGHSNHIHVCFKNTPQTKETCDKFVPDVNVCPELQ